MAAVVRMQSALILREVTIASVMMTTSETGLLVSRNPHTVSGSSSSSIGLSYDSLENARLENDGLEFDGLAMRARKTGVKGGG